MKKDILREKIIGPILANKPPSMTEEDFLKVVFSTDSRVISAYYVNGGTNLPGIWMENGCIPVGDRTHKRGKRIVKRGDILWVRVDDRAPNLIHVEHKGHVFLLTRSLWNSLKRKIVKMTGSQEV